MPLGCHSPIILPITRRAMTSPSRRPWAPIQLATNAALFPSSSGTSGPPGTAEGQAHDDGRARGDNVEAGRQQARGELHEHVLIHHRRPPARRTTFHRSRNSWLSMLTSCKEHHPRDHGCHPTADEPGDLDQRAVELDRGHRLVLLSRGLAAGPPSGEGGRLVSVGAGDCGLGDAGDTSASEYDLSSISRRSDDEDPPVSKDQMSRTTSGRRPTAIASRKSASQCATGVRSAGTISRRT